MSKAEIPSEKKISRPKFRVRPVSNQFLAQEMLKKPSKRTSSPVFHRTQSQIKTKHTPRGNSEVEDFELNEDKFEFKLDEHLKSDFKGALIHDSHAVDRFTCHCTVCLISPNVISDGNANANADFFSGDQMPTTLGSDNDRDFNFVMRRLHPPKHISRSVRLFVPDTALLAGGEIRWIVTTGKDKTLKLTKTKEKMGFQELRKFFYERRRRREDYNFGGGFDDGQHNQITFQPKTETGRVAKEDRANLGKAVEKLVKEAENINNREVALIKFNKDNVTQVLTELEFSYFMQRRKVDKIWKDIQYIQTFIRTKQKGLSNCVKVYFLYDKEKDKELFIRAKTEILIINGDIPKASEEYVSLGDEEHFEETLKASSEETFCMYTLYKIVHFLEIISAVKILRMSAEFAKDEAGFFWLLNLSDVRHVSYQQNIREELQIKNVDKLLQEENNKLSQELEVYYRNLERKETIKLLNNIMKQHYDAQKKKIGLDDYVESYFNDDISDELFAKIHPDAPFKLSELLKTKSRYDEIREFILKNTNRLQSERHIREGALVVPKPVRTSQDLTMSQLRGSQTSRRGNKTKNDPMIQSIYNQGRSLGQMPISSKIIRESRSPSIDIDNEPKSYQLLRQSAENTSQTRRTENTRLAHFRAVKFFNGKKSFHPDNNHADYINDADEVDTSNVYRNSRLPTNEMTSGSYTNRPTTYNTSRGLSKGTAAIPISSRGFSAKTQLKIAKVISETPHIDTISSKDHALSNLLNSRR